MKDFSIHLKSTEASNIYVNGAFIGLIDNYETFIIDLKVYSKSLVITKEPISKNKKLLLPYTVKLNFANSKISCDSDFVTIVPYKLGEYDILLNSCDIKSHKKLEKVYDDFVDNYNLIVVNDGSSYINLYHMNVLKYTTTISEINNIICEKKNKYIIIKGVSLNSKYYLLIIDETNFKEVVNTECEQLEQDAERIKYLKKLNDIAKHASVFELNFEDGSSVQEYYVYLKNQAVITESEKLVPYAFLEAIKINNFALAKDYLSANLKEKASEEHLKQYFSNISSIHYNCYFKQDNVINYTVKCGSFKNYDFTVINNKIEDIDEVTIN